MPQRIKTVGRRTSREAPTPSGSPATCRRTATIAPTASTSSSPATSLLDRVTRPCCRKPGGLSYTGHGQINAVATAAVASARDMPFTSTTTAFVRRTICQRLQGVLGLVCENRARGWSTTRAARDSSTRDASSPWSPRRTTSVNDAPASVASLSRWATTAHLPAPVGPLMCTSVAMTPS